MENDSQYEEAMIFQFKADARQGSIATLNQALKRKMGPSSSNHASSQAQKGCPLRTQTIAAGRLRGPLPLNGYPTAGGHRRATLADEDLVTPRTRR
jgi:hypothetical protein